MTNLEAVINTISVTGYSDGAVNKAIIDFGIVPNADYVPESSLIVNKAALQVLKGMLAIAQISEGNYTLQYSIAGIQARIADLEGVIGITGNTQPKIRNKSFLW